MLLFMPKYHGYRLILGLLPKIILPHHTCITTRNSHDSTPQTSNYSNKTKYTIVFKSWNFVTYVVDMDSKDFILYVLCKAIMSCKGREISHK